MYDLSPPKVTTLYALSVPRGDDQTLRYDDGTGDELKVPLGTTAFVSGSTMFEILPKELKSLAVRAKVRYAPHPYVWMAPAHAMSTGLGIETEGLELPLEELPAWEESKIKTFPVVSAPLRITMPELHLTECFYPALEEPSHWKPSLPGPPLRCPRVDHRSLTGGC